jgi:hypothetical protein
MRETVATRCSMARADRELAKRCRVNDWPEVEQIIAAWHALKELPGAPRLRAHGEDPEVDVVLGALALGYEPDHLERILRHLAQHPKFSDKALLRAVLKPETLQIAVAEMRKQQPRRQTSAPRTMLPEVSAAERRANAAAARADFEAKLAAQRTPPRAPPAAEPDVDVEPLRSVGAAE